MSSEILIDIFLAVFSAIIGIIIAVFFDRPYFKIKTKPSGRNKIDSDECVFCYRLSINNNRKFFGLLGNQAKECICEIRFDTNRLDSWYAPWLYGELYNCNRLKIDINNGTSGQVDFCGRVLKKGNKFEQNSIIAPLNGKWTLIGDINNSISGEIIISSENRGYNNSKFTIISIDGEELAITIKDNNFLNKIKQIIKENMNVIKK